MKAYGNGCIDPHFLDLGTSHAPAALPRWKSPRYPLDRRLGGPQSQSGRYREGKILDPTGTRTPAPRSSSPYLVAPYMFTKFLILLRLYSPSLCLVRFFHTVNRIPWTGDQPAARPLPTHRTTRTLNKRTLYRHPCVEWDSKPRSQRPSERTQCDLHTH
jgi:hypothetical protein